MAAFYASEIASGVKPEEANVDLERSLEPFAIFYDDHCAPTTSNGHLNQAIPSPPRGVFSYLRTPTAPTPSHGSPSQTSASRP
jgi:hypothetical protein